jgi:hypothetical protein
LFWLGNCIKHATCILDVDVGSIIQLGVVGDLCLGRGDDGDGCKGPGVDDVNTGIDGRRRQCRARRPNDRDQVVVSLVVAV